MQSYEDVFRRFVPQEAAKYCLKLWEHFGFEFKIKKSRQTKLGDYRYAFKTKKHTITINNDLNPYAFLVTYLHEVAHLITFEEHGRKVSPHGTEWKSNFVKVAKPMLNEQVFPAPVLNALLHYFKNPKASSCSDPALYNVLRQFDGPSDLIPLSKIAPGSSFVFNDVIYRKLEKKRTRSVCLQLETNRKYLISEVAQVKAIQN